MIGDQNTVDKMNAIINAFQKLGVPFEWEPIKSIFIVHYHDKKFIIKVEDIISYVESANNFSTYSYKIVQEYLDIILKEYIEKSVNMSACNFKEARNLMISEFKKDEGLLASSLANVSISLYDYQENNNKNLDFSYKETRDQVAKNIMKLLFDLKDENLNVNF